MTPGLRIFLDSANICLQWAGPAHMNHATSGAAQAAGCAAYPPLTVQLGVCSADEGGIGGIGLC